MHPVTNVAAFPYPGIRAKLLRTGQNVTLIARGDREGSSTICQPVDEQGQILEWESAKEFRVIDTNVLPPNTAAYDAAMGQTSRR